jgi:hypothetical protein
MARDIEEFLRKAAERRRQQQAEKQGGAAGKKPVRPQPTRQPPRQPPRREPQPNIVEAVEAVDDEIIEARPVQRQPATSSSRRRSVQSGVESHIDTSKIASHADQIGSLKVQKSGDVDKVKQKFDRGARKFETRHTTRDNTDDEIVGQDVSAVATDLIQMLRDPKSIRQAILVSEILRRPDFDD